MGTASSSRSTSRSRRLESLTGRYAFARSQQVFPLGGLGFGAGSRLPQFAQSSPTRVQLVSASLLSTLSATQDQRSAFRLQPLPHVVQCARCELRSGQLRHCDCPVQHGDRQDRVAGNRFRWDVRKPGSQRVQHSARAHQPEFPDPRQLHLAEGTPHDEVWRRVRRASISSFNDNLERGLFSFGFDTSSLALCPGESAGSC